jgi:hypothetical protein
LVTHPLVGAFKVQRQRGDSVDRAVTGEGRTVKPCHLSTLQEYGCKALDENLRSGLLKGGTLPIRKF